MKKIFLFCISLFFSAMMFAQVLIWKDGEVVYRKNIDEVDRITFYQVEDFKLLNDTIEMEYYGDYQNARKWIHVEFVPKNSYGVLEYTSSDESVVTVSYDGFLISRGIGESMVTVKMLGTDIVRTCKVIVKGYSGEFYWPIEFYFAPKQSSSLLYSYFTSNPYCESCQKDLEWKSSDETIATIDENGRITALALGQSVITATLKGTDISASTVVHVEHPGLYVAPFYEEEQDEVRMGLKGTKYLRVRFKNDNFSEYLYYELEWESTNEDVVMFVDKKGVYFDNYMIGVGVGTADVIVRLAGTDECDTIRVVVSETDPMTVRFHNVLYRDNLREFPLGYDCTEDGENDVIREIDMWILGDKLVWDAENQTVSGKDYVIWVRTACLYDGLMYNLSGDYHIANVYDEYSYLQEYKGEKYFLRNQASTSFFDPYYYCRYYESLLLSDTVDDHIDEMKNLFMRDKSSYIYYWDTENNDINLAGLVSSGNFGVDMEVTNDGFLNMYVSFMQLGLSFFADTPYGLLTEDVYDEETGEMREILVEPFQVAPYIERNIFYDDRYGGYLKSPEKKQGISEKAIKANQVLNIPLQMRLQGISF